MQIKEIRSALNVPDDQRIGQWIYNCNRDKEVRSGKYTEPQAGFAQGVDIFDREDKEFLTKLTNAY